MDHISANNFSSFTMYRDANQFRFPFHCQQGEVFFMQLVLVARTATKFMLEYYKVELLVHFT